MSQKTKHILWAMVPILIGIIFVFVITENLNSKKIPSGKIFTDNIFQNKINERKNAENFYFIKNPTKKPRIMAEAYYVGDLNTGEVILEKAKDKEFPIASVSKLMTALISKEYENQEKTVLISKNTLNTEGKNGDLRLNEKIKIGDLIYPLVLESSNDAAEAIASSSDRDSFIKKMNEKTEELGMRKTFFSDPSGLSPYNKSTAYDLFKFSMYLKEKTPELLRISTLKSYKNEKHIWFNNSQFLGISGYQGGKRGFINESKQTSLSLFSVSLGKEGNRDIGIILLRSPDRYKDTQNILEYLNKNVYYGTIADANMDWVKSRDGVLEEKEPSFVTMLFGGDLMLDRGVESSVTKNFGGDFSRLFEKLDILKEADIVFANLEGPASDQGKDLGNLYSFRMSPGVLPALKGAGFLILSVANNHVGDWGRDAYIDTLARLKENEIIYTGGGNNASEAEEPKIVEKNGIKIGFIGFSDVGPDWMASNTDKAGILLANNPRFEEIIKNASGKVDFLVVSFHFGEEYKTKHNQRQESLAHRAIDNGAKIVIGHHPHVVEDTEVYKSGFVAYSLGNFIFDQKFSAETMQGMLLKIELAQNGDMIINKNIVKLNSVFQPEKIIKGESEKIKGTTN